MRKLSIRTKMFFAYGASLVAVMLCLVIAFSLMISGYMNGRIKKQILQFDELSDEYAKQYGKDSARFGDELSGEIRKRIYASAEIEAVMISGSRGSIISNINYDYAAKKEAVEALAKKASGSSVQNGKIRYVSGSFGRFVMMKLSLGTSEEYKDCSIVVFSDLGQFDGAIVDSQRFLRITVLFAVAVMIIAVFLVADNISRPVKKLCSFANDIGHGEFEHKDYDFNTKELSELLRDMNSAAEKLDKYDKDQKQFFQNVSHELRTPLMSIQGYAEGIQYGVWEDDKDAAGVIVDESKRLSDMLEQVLYISKVDMNLLELSPCDICDILRTAKEKLDGLTVGGEKKIVLTLPESEVLVNANPEALLRAFMNVISNGIRYAKSKVEVTLEKSGKSVSVTVRDDGDGIDAEDMPHIFDRFYKGKNGKHGIGLSIAKTIMDAHGGTLCAESKDGAVFTFTFKE